MGLIQVNERVTDGEGIPGVRCASASAIFVSAAAGKGARLVRRARCGIRVEAAIHCIALGKSERVAGARVRPVLLTIVREIKVARDMAGRN